MIRDEDLCRHCQGACCEMFWTEVPPNLEVPGNKQWLRLRGAVAFEPHRVRWEIPCAALVDGKCSIYRRRPATCREFARGCPECLEIIALRRPALAAQLERQQRKVKP